MRRAHTFGCRCRPRGRCPSGRCEKGWRRWWWKEPRVWRNSEKEKETLAVGDLIERRIYIDIHTQIWMYVCMLHIHILTLIYLTYKHTNIHTYTHTNIQTYKQTNKHTYIYIYMYTYTFMYTHTYSIYLYIISIHQTQAVTALKLLVDPPKSDASQAPKWIMNLWIVGVFSIVKNSWMLVCYPQIRDVCRCKEPMKDVYYLQNSSQTPIFGPSFGTFPGLPHLQWVQSHPAPWQMPRKCHGLTVEEMDQHFRDSTPVVLTDAQEGWPAREKWTFEWYLDEKNGCADGSEAPPQWHLVSGRTGFNTIYIPNQTFLALVDCDISDLLKKPCVNIGYSCVLILVGYILCRVCHCYSQFVFSVNCLAWPSVQCPHRLRRLATAHGFYFHDSSLHCHDLLRLLYIQPHCVYVFRSSTCPSHHPIYN